MLKGAKGENLHGWTPASLEAMQGTQDRQDEERVFTQRRKGRKVKE
jgi:hypothetical protein